jgi:large subunit ribosomal protein L18
MSREISSYKRAKKIRRRLRIRAKVKGTAKTPRLSVFRSNAHVYAQLIDDASSKTLASVSDLGIKKSKGAAEKSGAGRKISISREIGFLIAKEAKKLGLTGVVFDRGGLKYHGRVKAVAEGAREGGLKF